ncbi:phage-related protein [Alkalihalobacillus xiaoxiensis]|uniref:Phage-related protein n=1 Tax=Shouchella xiaoxiensis TaxID=766895 RepID=A0ABS2SV69_9BACI|nr:type II toxin-antitoxin system RelE/ParE family toxin [Shouchella xiaoxiensis]MBM7839433.1 phage-related protein [Shouchella xiaoxiensis]
MSWSLTPYVKPNKSKPVVDYIDTLKDKEQAKVDHVFNLIRKNGTRTGMPYIRHLDDGIWEIRIAHSSNIFRVTLFHFEGNELILLHGFTKKTQKTPPKEIKRAKAYREDFKKRKDEIYGLLQKESE